MKLARYIFLYLCSYSFLRVVGEVLSFVYICVIKFKIILTPGIVARAIVFDSVDINNVTI